MLQEQVDGVQGQLQLLSQAHDTTRKVADHAVATVEETHHRAELTAALAERTAHELQIVGEILSTLHDHHARLTELERVAAVATVTQWVLAADVPEDLQISVVMPTYNRSHLVGRAIASVTSQPYANWELLVVDDGSTDTTPEVLAAYDDPRIRVLTGSHAGCCAARNRALAAATGDVVAYLDDDNVLGPVWLKAVAWAFRQRPDTDVLYGARIIEDRDELHASGPGQLPWTHVEPYDRATLEQGNIADMGVLAHRAGLAEATFDESLSSLGDWDLLLRLTRERPPLELPVVAVHYTTSGARITDLQDRQGESARIRAKVAAAAARPGAPAGGPGPTGPEG